MKVAILRLYGLPRRVKQLTLAIGDALCLPALFWVSLALRYDTIHPPTFPGARWGLPFIGVVGVCALAATGVYRAVVRAFDEKFLQSLLVSVASMVGVLFALASVRALPVPRSTPLMYGFFVFLWVWASRSAIRGAVRFLAQIQAPATRVAIYGAGAAGRQLLAAMRAAPEYSVVALFDDSRHLVGATIQGLRVHAGNDFAATCDALAVTEVLLALPSVSRTRRREVIERLQAFRVRVRTLPGFAQLLDTEVSLSDIREVDISDLLGRDPVPPSVDLLAKDISGKRVLITGAGGSIGSELSRQVLTARPALLLIWELSEYALYRVERELKCHAPGIAIVPILGSVLDQERMTQVMRQYSVDTVYHAAAYKHVPLVESNPFEGIVNNTVGTQRAARAAMKAGVSTFVLISTDKAVRPTNVMGASKRLAEMVLQAHAAEPETRTRFCMVRFGNVLGSSGSVVPLFREQIAAGGPVTVTHPEVTRYFMTIPEAAQLVIQAGAMGDAGDVFVLEMGEPVKIADLARKMIRLSGMSVRGEDGNEEGDIEVAFTGMRPGEKLYEELLIGTNVSPTEHPRIMRARESFCPRATIEAAVGAMEVMAKEYDVAALKDRLASLIDGYVPDMTFLASSEPAPPAFESVAPKPLERVSSRGLLGVPLAMHLPKT